MRLRSTWLLACVLACVGTAPAQSQEPAPVQPPMAATPASTPTHTRSGREIYRRFREGLADPTCAAGGSPRWRAHFANAPRQMAARSDDVMPLFGYVVDAVREARLPTEFALIPFVESGYKPGARSASGPAGLWQFIGVTARNQHIPIRAGYDGRLSPVDSTKAAVRYLKTLHGMFAGDWRLAVMAYNAGEYRVLQSLRRSGLNARNAQPDKLAGLSGITHAYVHKLHALSCLIGQAEDRDDWFRAIDRPVPVLQAEVLPADVTQLDAWAEQRGIDAALLRRMNPVFANGRVQRGDRAIRVLVPSPALTPTATEIAVGAPVSAPEVIPPSSGVAAVAADMGQARTHKVQRGESASTIAHKYKLPTADLLRRNGLTVRSTLKPGMTLKLDGE